MESPVWSDHKDLRRLERVSSWELELAVVKAPFIDAISKSEDDEVPDKDVVLLWRSIETCEVCSPGKDHELFIETLRATTATRHFPNFIIIIKLK